MSDEYGPPLPPGFTKESSGRDSGDSEGMKAKEGAINGSSFKSSVIGPMLPPGFKTGNTEDRASMDSIGPVLPPGFKSDTEERVSDIGPALPPGFKSSSSSEDRGSAIGPALPPGFKPSSSSEDRGSAIGPALPPGFKSSSGSEDRGFSIGPALPPGFNRRPGIVGPSLPPGFSQDTEDDADRDDDDDDDDDDDFVIGPMPPSGPTHEESVAAEVERRAEKMKKKLLGEDEIETPVVTERESWMTELPPDMGVNLGLGPRKFRSQPLPEKGDRSAWTDTPADRERKAKEMQEGRGSKRQHEEVFISERDRKITAQLQEYNETQRKESLMDMHSKKLKKKKKEEEDKPKERREFSREDDLQVNRFDDAKRKQLIKKSQQLNSRFAHGKSGQFL